MFYFIKKSFFNIFFQKTFVLFLKLNRGFFTSFFVLTFFMIAKIGVTPIFADCNIYQYEGVESDYTGPSISSKLCLALGSRLDENGCCALNFSGLTVEQSNSYCLSLNGETVSTYYSTDIACSSNFFLINRVDRYDAASICCAGLPSQLSFEEQCSNHGWSGLIETEESGTYTSQRYITYNKDQKTGKFICDEGDELVTGLIEEDRACCQKNPAATEDIFILDVNVNHLKFQSLLDMNPLQSSSVFSDPNSRTPGNIINQALTAVVFPIAGVGLLILILLGGFQVLSGSLGGKQNNIDLGKKRVTAAIIGFTLLFLVYWIWRLIALATGLSV